MKQFKLFVLVAAMFFTAVTYSQWTEQTTGITGVVYSVSAVDDNIAWACAATGIVVKTTNGGVNWVSVTSPGASDLYNIFALDANTALTTSSPSSGTFVYRTTNGGVSWTQVFFQATGFMNVIWLTSSSNGLMVGDPVGGRWSIWKTTNGGVNWDSTGLFLAQVSGEAGWNNSIYVNGSNIWFGTNSTRLYYSSNSGTNWIAQTTPAPNQYAVWFNTASVGLSGGSNMYVTVNSGSNWSNMTAPGTGNISGITGKGTTWWFVRQASSIYKSTNNGTTWTTDYTAPSGTYSSIGIARNGNRIWALRNNGGISKNDGPVGITPVSNEIPSSFSLAQNYPNPFNPSTTFKFNVPSASNVSLKVYDMMGREISIVVNESLQAGVYEVKFDASTISSGVYFYTLTAGNFSETKKMMLVK